MKEKNWIKEIKEALVKRFLTEDAKAKYDELDWAKYIYFDIQDFIEKNSNFLNNIFEKFFRAGKDFVIDQLAGLIKAAII